MCKPSGFGGRRRRRRRMLRDQRRRPLRVAAQDLGQAVSIDFNFAGSSCCRRALNQTAAVPEHPGLQPSAQCRFFIFRNDSKTRCRSLARRAETKPEPWLLVALADPDVARSIYRADNSVGRLPAARETC
jgi:hypothetical protein